MLLIWGANLTAAQLSAAEAGEARAQAENAKEAIGAKFDEHVRDAEENIQMLREELSSCAGELWAAVTAAKAAAAASDAKATEAHAEASSAKVWGRTEAAQNEAMRTQLAEHEEAARGYKEAARGYEEGRAEVVVDLAAHRTGAVVSCTADVHLGSQQTVLAAVGAVPDVNGLDSVR